MSPFKISNYLFYLNLLHRESSYSSRLSYDDRRRRARKIPRCAIRRHQDSPFRFLYHSSNDQAMLNITGLDHAVFRQLLVLFEPVYRLHTYDYTTNRIRKLKLRRDGTPYGRPRELDAAAGLGLVLMWYRTRGPCTRGLLMAFGVTSSPLYMWLLFSRRILLFVLMKVKEAQISFPTEQEIEDYVAAISAKYPILTDERVWGAVDV